jgi:asparagine synthetase B (glutamine-hydrolysing)
MLTDKEKFLSIGYITAEFEPHIHTSEKRPFNVKEFRKALFSACTVTERDVAVLLSGGLDSSLVAWALKETGHKVHAYCVGYTDDPGEVAGAQWVAKKLRIPITVVKVSAEDCFKVFPFWVRAQQKTNSEWSGIPLALLMMEVSKKYNYVITGDGGDDLFGGYVYFKAMLEAEKGLDEAVKTPERRAERFYSMMRDVKRSPKVDKYMIKKLTKYFEGVSLVEGMSNWTTEQWLYQGMLPKIHTAMAMSGLMAYAPLIELDEYANTLPDEDRVDKKAIREMLRHTPLKKLVTKPKLGFKPPFTKWLQQMPWRMALEGTGNFREDLINFRELIWEERQK